MKTKTIFIKTKSYIELLPIFIKSKNLYLLETKIHKKVNGMFKLPLYNTIKA